MLRSLNELEGYAIGAADGEIGRVKDFLFDDETWAVRYLVVDTGSWLSSRKVLISPIAVGEPTWADRILPVSITKQQVRNSPNVDTDKPVSRQYELGYFDYYGYYPYYWGASGLWGASDYPGTLMTDLGRPRSAVEPQTVAADRARMALEIDQHRNDDPHLRSVNAVMHYDIEATDGGIGHVQGLLLDEQTWAIRYLIVDTSNWWQGQQVLIAPRWIDGISWSERTVSINLAREAIRGAPAYDAAQTLDRAAEFRLHEHYRRTGYWADQVQRENPEFRPVKAVPERAVHKYT
jgi:hypothetical protein